MSFLVVARNGAGGYQCSDSLLLHLSRGVVVPLLARLRTRAHDYSFCHPMDRSAYDYASAYVEFQRLTEVDWPRCNIDDCWNYYTFKSGSIHDVPTSVVETRKPDAGGNLITGRTLPLREVFWVVPGEHRATFDKATAPMRFEGNDRVEDVPPPSNGIEDRLAMEVNLEDDWDLWDIWPSGSTDFQSSLPGNFSLIQWKGFCMA